MLPTPSTSHVPYERVYEPAEDSFLFLNTLSSESEKTFLQDYFNQPREGSTFKNSSTPLVVEIGTGSGVVLSFLHVHAENILGRQDILTAGVDVNRFACKATTETIRAAELVQDIQGWSHGFYLGNILGDLTGFLKPSQVDLLIFNPPYVPTPELPQLPQEEAKTATTYEDDSHLLSLSYAGGIDGMEITNRLLQSLPNILSSSRGVRTSSFVLRTNQRRSGSKSRAGAVDGQWKRRVPLGRKVDGKSLQYSGYGAHNEKEKDNYLVCMQKDDFSCFMSTSASKPTNFP